MRVAVFVVLFLVVASATTSSARASWWGYGSYDECVIGEMRGQTDAMIMTVRSYCRSEFPVEDEQLSRDGFITVNVNELRWEERRPEDMFIKVWPSEKYVPVGAEMYLGTKSCDQLTSSDKLIPVPEFEVTKARLGYYLLMARGVSFIWQEKSGWVEVRCKIVKSWKVVPR